MKITKILMLLTTAAFLGGCGGEGETSSSEYLPGGNTSTSKVQPGTQFSFESGEYISDATANFIIKYDSETSKLGIDVYGSFGSLVEGHPTPSMSSENISYSFTYVERYDAINVYDSSAMTFSFAYNNSTKDYSIFYAKTSDEQKGELYMVVITKSGDSQTYAINPLVKYKESKVYSLAKNAVKPGGNSYTYRSNVKTHIKLKDGLSTTKETEAYIQIRYDSSINYFCVDYTEDGIFVGNEHIKTYSNFNIKNFKASFAYDEVTLSKSKIKMHTWNEDAKSYKFAIETDGGNWVIDEVEMIRTSL